MHPWDDPNLMPVYHVQLETRDLIVSYTVATNDYNAVEFAIADLRTRLVDPNTHVWKGSLSEVGYHEIGEPIVIEWEIAKGCQPEGILKTTT